MPMPFENAAPMDAKTVRLNGRPLPWQPGLSLQSLLQQAAPERAPEQYATAVNACFVPRAGRATRLLQAGDDITCFEAIVGG